MAEIKYEIVKEIGVLSSRNNGWNKEINLVKWNAQEPVYDIRTWSENHEKMGKGVTLTEQEVRELAVLLNELNI